MTNVVEYEQTGPLAWIRLNRPDALNAVNIELINGLKDAVEQAESDMSVRAIILTGKGRAFCAGGDLKELQDGLDSNEPGRRDLLDIAPPVFNALRDCKKPLIGAVNGIALAGGLELLLCCDVIFAAETARIGDSHSNFGLIPGGGGAAVLPRRIGLHRAKALLFSGERFPAKAWQEWGLVHEVVPDDELETAVEAYGQKLAKKSPLVLSAIKSVANASMETSEYMSLRNELLALREYMKSSDLREGLNSFVEKREPRFEGR